MTIQNDTVLWDNGTERLTVLAVPAEKQYRYPPDRPCLTVGFRYENPDYKGSDVFTFFDNPYTALCADIESAHRCLTGSFRLFDMGVDTDGYIDVDIHGSSVTLHGQLGASFSSYFLRFELEADQTILALLLESISA